MDTKVIVEESQELQNITKEESVGPWKMVWLRFKKKKIALTGVIILIILVLSAVFAPFLTPYSPDEMNFSNVNAAPSRQNWMGTDNLGRDYFTRLLYGGRVSLMVGVISAFISVTLGSTIGGIAGFFGGRVDNILMRFAEIVMSFPFLPLAITISAVVGANVAPETKMYIVMMIIGCLSWPGLSRIVRGQILSLKEQEFVLAAKALGIPNYKIILKHLIPNTIGYIIVSAALSMANAIMAESGLSFLGLGVVPPTPTWGNMVQHARNLHVLRTRPWLWIPPGVAILLAVMSINLLGDGLRDAIDPKSNN
ncbi:oligopeptide ABC transporter permease [Alkaliphilus peptidifermentans]|uniref:Peptide/nickel transport system permease protein n=1 Tax=Alkaliphilus peptidifermentans DSM 18978 TaxID=1120976 RepID=A0A1G5BII1_9FIRM|nr:oligopeptide ABC transporter permease [Alkaliphilus peptidifermentans]SCX90012.1 peptide/nickel transport system permease protein [Alkaliphilus peptidifermentans DSM 18978]